jgi:hypothetical protein
MKILNYLPTLKHLKNSQKKLIKLKKYNCTPIYLFQHVYMKHLSSSNSFNQIEPH